MLTDGFEELDADEVHIAGVLLSLDPSLNRRHASGNQRGGCDRGGRNRQSHNFVDGQRPRAGQKRTYATDI